MALTLVVTYLQSFLGFLQWSSLDYQSQTVDLREIANTIFYWVDNGIKWRAMPLDLPNWSTVYDYYRCWVKTGLWEQINAQLVKLERLAEGRDEQLSLASVDSQSARSSENKGAEQEVDSYKCVKYCLGRVKLA